MSPYTLPDGNVQIAFSGGRTSAYMLHQILEANGSLPDRVVVAFQNTGLEHPATLDFVQACGDRWGVPIVWLEYVGGPPVGFAIVGHNSASRNGEPFRNLIRRRAFLPNVKARFCTVELKVRTSKRYLRAIGWDRWWNCAGLRADEKPRLKGLPRSWTPAIGEPRARDRWICWTPLADAVVSKHDVALFWRRQPFDLRLPNVKGKTPLGNCVGCFLKSEATIHAVARDFPEHHAWWEEEEAWVRDAWEHLTPWGQFRRIITANPELPAQLRSAYGKPIPERVIRSIVDEYRASAGQFSKRYSRAEVRSFVERQGSWIFSTEGALCQASDGECFG